MLIFVNHGLQILLGNEAHIGEATVQHVNLPQSPPERPPSSHAQSDTVTMLTKIWGKSRKLLPESLSQHRHSVHAGLEILELLDFVVQKTSFPMFQ